MHKIWKKISVGFEIWGDAAASPGTNVPPPMLSYKIYQLISWDIVTMDTSMRVNVTRNEAKMKDQLLVHVWCGLRATRCVVEGNVEVSCQCLKFDACYELCVAWLRRIESVSSLPKTHRVLRATRRASQLMNWWIVNENDSLIAGY